MKHSLFGLCTAEKYKFHASREGHQMLSQLFGRNDLFTTTFTFQMGRGKLQWGTTQESFFLPPFPL
jgi:hypothetical protein